MAFTPVTVTGNLETLIGGTPNLGRIWFKLNRADWNVDGDIFAPEFAEAIADPSGAFTATLQSTTGLTGGAMYSALLRYLDPLDGHVKEYTLARFALPPGGPYQLADLLNVPIVDPVPADILALAIAAQTAAASSAAAAASSAASVSTPYATRASAIAATIAAPVTRISVIHAGTILEYIRDATGTALTTAGAVNWSPVGQSTVLHWGAFGDGATNDTAAFTAALAWSTGSVYVPWTSSHYVLTVLSAADHARLWGPGKILISSVLYEISSVPLPEQSRAHLRVTNPAWTPTADFAAVDVGDGPMAIDVTRKGSIGSFGWASILGLTPDEKGPGVNDHLLSVWLNTAKLSGGRANAFWPGVNTPASNIAGHTYTLGAVTVAEFNHGNRWANFGIVTTFSAAPGTAALLIAPDVNPSVQGENWWTVAGITIASPGVLTVTGHNFTNNMGFRIYANGGTLPVGLTDGEVYWIVNVSGATFQLAATIQGTPINTTGTFAAGVRGLPSYPATNGIVFSKSIHHHQIAIPITVETDTIQDGGHWLFAKGSSSSVAKPSNLVAMTGNWLRAFDFSTATFTSGVWAVVPDNIALRMGSSTGGGVRGTSANIDVTSGTGAIRLMRGSFGTSVFEANATGIGFNGTAPIAKPTLPAAASDLATVITLANAMRLSGFINYGLTN